MFRNFRLYLKYFEYYVTLKSSGECQLFSFNGYWTQVCSYCCGLTLCEQSFQCQVISQILCSPAMGLICTWAAQNELRTCVHSHTELRDTLLHFFPLHHLSHFLWLLGTPFLCVEIYCFSESVSCTRCWVVLCNWNYPQGKTVKGIKRKKIQGSP